MLARLTSSITALLLLTACSAGQEIPPKAIDSLVSQPDLYVAPDAGAPRFDQGVTPDSAVRPRDSAPKLDTGCQVGTPNACASCTDRCPGPTSSSGTERVCLGAKCDIQCKGEHYDVNGDAKDGCEFVDDLPIHELESSAASLGSFSDCKNQQSTQAVMPSDSRLHVSAPTQRENGRGDFFKMSISDDWGCSVNADVEVSFAGLPTGARFVVNAYYRCNDGTRLASKSSAGSGGSTIKLSPSVSCSTGSLGDDSGTVYVEVKKQSGPHSNSNYTVRITP